ncbi:hypothetical protein D3C80_1663980 [compost metagenome]
MAVVPFDPLAQGKGITQAIGTDVPGRGQQWFGVEVAVIGQQAFGYLAGDEHRRAGGVGQVDQDRRFDRHMQVQRAAGHRPTVGEREAR